MMSVGSIGFVPEARILAAAAMNFKRVMNLWRTEANGCWKLIEILYSFVLNILLPEKLKTTF